MTSTPFKVACIQNCAGLDLERNIAECSDLVRGACALGAELVCLPEYFVRLDSNEQRAVAEALPEEGHPALAHFTALARELGAWILLGSIPVRVAPDKVNNRSYLLGNDGGIVARYNKLHLFDVDIRDGQTYRESASVRGGTEAVLAPTPWGVLGMTICYDLRFPYLYRALAQAGASFLAVPAAFTQKTGEAHWEVLLRARAIETGCYVFAPCQCGEHDGGRRTYGHSLIVDPWGEVLADGGEVPGFVIAEVDPARVDEVRRMIPSLQHDRGFSGPAESGSRPTAREA